MAVIWFSVPLTCINTNEFPARSYMIELNLEIPSNSQLWNVEINVLRRIRTRLAIAFAWGVSLVNFSGRLGTLCDKVGVGVLIIYILRVSSAKSPNFFLHILISSKRLKERTMQKCKTFFNPFFKGESNAQLSVGNIVSSI